MPIPGPISTEDDCLPGSRARRWPRPAGRRLLALAGAALAGLGLLLGGCSPATSSPAATATRAPAQPTSAAVAPPTAAVAAPTAPPAPVSITLGPVGPNALLWTSYVAMNKGLFEQAGVKVDVTFTGSTANTTQQLVAGAIDIGHGSVDSYVRAIEAGAPIVAVAGEQATPTYSLLGQPSLSGVADLRGKLVMIGGPKDPTLFFIQRMLRPNGLADGDYELAYAGSTGDRFSALQSGGVAAGLLTQPFDFAAERQGYRRLVDQWDYPLDYQFIGYGVRRDWAQSHEDALVRYLRGFRAASRWLHDPANRDAAVALLSDEVKLQPEDAQATYDLLIARLKAFSPEGVIAERAMQGVLDSIVALGDLPAPPPPVSKYLDNRYIEAAGR